MAEPRPHVSVFVPCYGYGRFLEQCVQSVLTQSVDVRVLILDDHSPDDTPEVAEKLMLDGRVEYVRHSRNMGHIATYNEGLEWAEGDYVVLLSADDLLTPGSLQRATHVLDSHASVGFTYGRALEWYIGGPQPVPSTIQPQCAHSVIPGPKWIAACFHRGRNSIWAPEVMVRTSLHREVGGYRPDLPHAADFELWMRLAQRGDVGVLDADQAIYRLHDTNMHHQHMRSTSDLDQRQDVFEIVLSELGRSTDTATLRRHANRALAKDWMVYASYALEMTGSRRESLKHARRATHLSVPGALLNRKAVAYAVRLMLGPERGPRLVGRLRQLGRASR